VCNPLDGPGDCNTPDQQPAAPVEFFPYPAVPLAAVEAGMRLSAAGGLDVGGPAYLDGTGGRRNVDDADAASNLLARIAQAFGFDPFERVVEFLQGVIQSCASKATVTAFDAG